MGNSQTAASRRYDAKHNKLYYLKLNKTTDAAILARLDEVESKQGYIKSLIRADMARNAPGSFEND